MDSNPIRCEECDFLDIDEWTLNCGLLFSRKSFQDSDGKIAIIGLRELEKIPDNGYIKPLKWCPRITGVV